MEDPVLHIKRIEKSVNGPNSSLRSGVFLVQRQHILHVQPGAKEDGGAFVDGLGLNVQNGSVAGAGQPTRVLHDEGDGIALIQ